MVHLYSNFGIPNYFSGTDKNIKLIIDPSKSYFSNQLHEDRKNYEFLFLIHGCEPQILNNIEDEILSNGDIFDLILSSSEKVCDKFKHSQLFGFGSCWVLTDGSNNLVQFQNEFKNQFSPDSKKFKLSFVKSGKNFLPGHRFRHEISDLLNKKYDFDIFYPQSIKPKLKLFDDSMFHITIENCIQKNYFSEKLIDCFMSYTLPIYWGCSNISDYFDINGMIIFNDKKELENILNNLTIDDYLSRIESMKNNYKISVEKKYAFFFDRINDIIKTL